jgi:hypothetical protein
MPIPLFTRQASVGLAQDAACSGTPILYTTLTEGLAVDKLNPTSIWDKFDPIGMVRVATQTLFRIRVANC